MLYLTDPQNSTVHIIHECKDLFLTSWRTHCAPIIKALCESYVEVQWPVYCACRVEHWNNGTLCGHYANLQVLILTVRIATSNIFLCCPFHVLSIANSQHSAKKTVFLRYLYYSATLSRFLCFLDRTSWFSYTKQTNEITGFKLIFNFCCLIFVFRTSWTHPQRDSCTRSMLCFTC
jgi:hypothetical protein